ncbi:hypothetical protein M432DRAFT_626841 [Thermoascus aurantiacus ATCC 26904]
MKLQLSAWFITLFTNISLIARIRSSRMAMKALPKHVLHTLCLNRQLSNRYMLNSWTFVIIKSIPASSSASNSEHYALDCLLG